MAEQRVNRTLELIKSKKSRGMIIEPLQDNEQFVTFHHLMKKLNITEPANEDDPNDLHPSDIFNDYYVYSCRICENYPIGHVNFDIIYDLHKLEDTLYESPDVATFEATEKQLEEFLMNLYYDNTIL